MSRMKEFYLNEVAPAMMKNLIIKALWKYQRLKKFCCKHGRWRCKDNPKLLEAAVNDLALITGQKPQITRAKKSVAAYKIRTGMPIGCKATLRDKRMYDFLDKLLMWHCQEFEISEVLKTPLTAGVTILRH